MSETALTGPAAGISDALQRLADGVWISTGRTVVLEGCGGLAVVDPGDEPVGTPSSPRGALAETLDLERSTGKRVGWLVVTHGHPDHTANLDIFKRRFPDALVTAHANGPCDADLAIVEEAEIPGVAEAKLIPTPGHSPWGDDLAVHLPHSRVLLSGDLVQPKGETWEQAFYPSPYPFFTDGGTYCASLERLAELPFDLLITGHREVRRGREAHRWVALTRAAIRRVERAVREWCGAEELSIAAVEIWRQLAKERGIPEAVCGARLDDRNGPSAFERFDLPGIRYYWQTVREGGGVR